MCLRSWLFLLRNINHSPSHCGGAGCRGSFTCVSKHPLLFLSTHTATLAETASNAPDWGRALAQLKGRTPQTRGVEIPLFRTVCTTTIPVHYGCFEVGLSVILCDLMGRLCAYWRTLSSKQYASANTHRHERTVHLIIHLSIYLSLSYLLSSLSGCVRLCIHTWQSAKRSQKTCGMER